LDRACLPLEDLYKQLKVCSFFLKDRQRIRIKNMYVVFDLTKIISFDLFSHIITQFSRLLVKLIFNIEI